MRKRQPKPERPFATAPATPEQRAAIEKLRQQLRSARPKEQKQPPVISAADYLRGIEKRRAFRQSERPSSALLEFARLADGDADRFKAKYPDYLPDELWKWQLPSDDELYQGSVFIGERPEQPSRPFWQGYRDLLRAGWAHAFSNEYVVRLLNITPAPSDPEDYIKPAMPAIPARDLRSDPVWPFQADILAVVRCGWPVRLCDWCGEPVLALRPNVKFCPGRGKNSCYVQHRRDAKKATWHRRKHFYRPVRKSKHRHVTV